MGPVKVALDVHAPDLLIEKLAEHDITVVYKASSGEEDEYWLPIARGLGANIYVSRDRDVENFADWNDSIFVWVPAHKKKSKLVQSLVDRILNAVKRNTPQPEVKETEGEGHADREGGEETTGCCSPPRVAEGT